MQTQNNLRLYTEDKKPLGKVRESQIDKIATWKMKDKEILPWLEYVTCFIICKQDKTVAIQKNWDSIGITLCSGYVKDGEINRIAMIRKLHDELGMYEFSDKELADNLLFCGKVKMDFTDNNVTKGNLRYFTTVYAIDIDDKSQVKPNENSVIRIAWADYDEIKRAIRASMLGFVYNEENSEVFEKIFNNIDKIVAGKKLNISAEDYERDWL